MGQKGHIMVQKGLKMHKKRQKLEFLDLTNLFLAEFSLADSGVPPYPLNAKSSCPKTPSGNGGYPPLLTGKKSAK